MAPNPQPRPLDGTTPRECTPTTIQQPGRAQRPCGDAAMAVAQQSPGLAVKGGRRRHPPALVRLASPSAATASSMVQGCSRPMVAAGPAAVAARHRPVYPSCASPATVAPCALSRTRLAGVRLLRLHPLAWVARVDLRRRLCTTLHPVELSSRPAVVRVAMEHTVQRALTDVLARVAKASTQAGRIKPVRIAPISSECGLRPSLTVQVPAMCRRGWWP